MTKTKQLVLIGINCLLSTFDIISQSTKKITLKIILNFQVKLYLEDIRNCFVIKSLKDFYVLEKETKAA